jgi:hypothetical protein
MPSLVQHASVKSTREGIFHQAHDFHPNWRSLVHCNI